MESTHGLYMEFNAYGVNYKACMLIASFFCNKKQRVQMGDVRSSLSILRKGAPQGSVLGPFILQNDLLCIITSLVDIFNYADDNTIGVQAASAYDVLSQL